MYVLVTVSLSTRNQAGNFQDSDEIHTKYSINKHNPNPNTQRSGIKSEVHKK
jgi:hypothetical protein